MPAGVEIVRALLAHVLNNAASWTVSNIVNPSPTGLGIPLTISSNRVNRRNT